MRFDFYFMKNILIHLHPDFAELLTKILTKWNEAQSEVNFVGIRPRKEHEVILLTGGEIQIEKTFPIIARVRTEAGYSPDDELIAFTEKRIHSGPYHQLYFGGTTSDESLPNLATISLDFTRKAFENVGKDEGLVFQTILSNIISSLAQSEGLNTHDDTRGCPLDFCNVMTDVLVGIKNGFSFCESHKQQIHRKKKNYLISLSSAVSEFRKSSEEVKSVSKRILSTDKARLQEDESEFNYDIALSYAREDENQVDQVANLLLKNNVKVFYDKFEQANLWGKDLHAYLTDVYMRAKYCVMFLSQNYARSRWTNLERRAAQSSAFQMNRDFILPVRLDDTEISGILPTTSFVHWSTEGANGITNLLIKKLKVI